MNQEAIHAYISVAINALCRSRIHFSTSRESTPSSIIAKPKRLKSGLKPTNWMARHCKACTGNMESRTIIKKGLGADRDTSERFGLIAAMEMTPRA